MATVCDLRGVKAKKGDTVRFYRQGGIEHVSTVGRVKLSGVVETADLNHWYLHEWEFEIVPDTTPFKCVRLSKAQEELVWTEESLNNELSEQELYALDAKLFPDTDAEDTIKFPLTDEGHEAYIGAIQKRIAGTRRQR